MTENKSYLSLADKFTPLIIGALGFVTITTFGISVRTRNINNKLEEISSNSVPSLITANVVGNSEPEKFYQFGTNRAYVEIDGKRVENYDFGGGK